MRATPVRQHTAPSDFQRGPASPEICSERSARPGAPQVRCVQHHPGGDCKLEPCLATRHPTPRQWTRPLSGPAHARACDIQPYAPSSADASISQEPSLQTPAMAGNRKCDGIQLGTLDPDSTRAGWKRVCSKQIGFSRRREERVNGKTEEVGWTWGTSLEPGKLSVRASHPGRPQQMSPTVNVGISYFNTDFAVLSAEERGVSFQLSS